MFATNRRTSRPFAPICVTRHSDKKQRNFPPNAGPTVCDWRSGACPHPVASHWHSGYAPLPAKLELYPLLLRCLIWNTTATSNTCPSFRARAHFVTLFRTSPRRLVVSCRTQTPLSPEPHRLQACPLVQLGTALLDTVHTPASTNAIWELSVLLRTMARRWRSCAPGALGTRHRPKVS